MPSVDCARAAPALIPTKAVTARALSKLPFKNLNMVRLSTEISGKKTRCGQMTSCGRCRVSSGDRGMTSKLSAVPRTRSDRPALVQRANSLQPYQFAKRDQADLSEPSAKPPVCGCMDVSLSRLFPSIGIFQIEGDGIYKIFQVPWRRLIRRVSGYAGRWSIRIFVRFENAASDKGRFSIKSEKSTDFLMRLHQFFV